MNSRTLLLVPALIAVLAGCVKESDPVSQRPLVTISASIPEDQNTKVAFEEAPDNGLYLSWESDDCIRVISGSASERYDILSDYSTHEARFRGPEVTGDKYTIIYPGTCASLTDAESYDFGGLEQDGNGSLEHLRYLAILEDVNTKEDISFSSEWASGHGGSFRRSGVVKFVLTLPDGLKNPARVELSGNGVNVGISLKNVSLTTSHVLTAYAPTSCRDIDIPSGTKLTFTVTDVQGGTWVRTQTISKATVLRAGVQSVFRLTKGFSETLFAGGSGTESDPYLISGAKHMFNMHADGVLEQGKKTWFKMIDDVDMSKVSSEWIPLNYDSPYSCEVDFNGDNHTIDNFTCNRTTESGAGFFRVLFGSVHDVKFTNASITNSVANPTGILASYGGYNGRPAVVYNVHVHGTVKSTVNEKGAGGVGGMFGRVNAIDVESSSADCDVTATWRFAGGLFGYDAGVSLIRNCWTSGSVNSAQRSGGIAGAVLKAGTEIINCYSLSAVTANLCVGGIAAHCTLDNGTEGDPPKLYPQNVYEKCIAWNQSVKTKTHDNANHYSSGAVIGYVATHTYLTDCMRRPDLDFSDYDDALVLYDQNNATPSTPLVIRSVSDKTYNYPYHGKAAAAGQTLSQVARNLGWNSTIWDMSGSVPVLTGKAIFDEAASGAGNAPTGTNPKPGQGEIRPAAGDGWTVTEVVPGESDIVYYAFDGVESYTKKTQQIFVIDFNLSSTKYKLQFVYENPSVTNSTVFGKYKALASINCGYEIASIVYKDNGTVRSLMPNNIIGSTGVANWKNEGAFYFDGNRNVKLSFDGYGLSINQQRKYYTSIVKDWSNMVTSAPMLINDWSPVGRTFVDQYSNSGNSEYPGVHQRATHPRTAVALTEGNHLLLIVVDGRYDNSGFSIGMSAKQLTTFLVNNFNPRYALNLDGGGSSTMCVKGLGVVNYPCDNSKESTGLPHDHDGERARDTHLVIVAR
ncbi:MAG: phosphodiester glycosidase family protein [Bacteroidales bacterium]|nr:phosphodiester glycosidase family protein [Bacteroidales bacterium]